MKSHNRIRVIGIVVVTALIAATPAVSAWTWIDDWTIPLIWDPPKDWAGIDVHAWAYNVDDPYNVNIMWGNTPQNIQLSHGFGHDIAFVVDYEISAKAYAPYWKVESYIEVELKYWSQGSFSTVDMACDGVWSFMVYGSEPNLMKIDDEYWLRHLWHQPQVGDQYMIEVHVWNVVWDDNQTYYTTASTTIGNSFFVI
jgi:hypothetical protein